MTVKKQNNLVMTEEEFAKELKGSVLILTTSSPDKRDIYRELFSSHARDKDHHAGLDLYFTDSGALGIVPRKTPEQTGEYNGNLDEKSKQQLAILQDPTIQQNIRLKLKNGRDNEFDAEKVNIIGMTEDSGWELKFDNSKIQKQFIEKIIEKLRPELREKDNWLIDKLHETGFPGPNLKPIQEHLEGGFDKLMTMIYDTAEELNIKKLKFSNSANISFSSPRLGKVYNKTFESGGTLITREEYGEKLLDTKRGDAINSNFIHIADGQKDNAQNNITSLIQQGLHTKSSSELPANYARRDIAEYMQNLVGKRRSSRQERKRHVNVAFVTPESLHDKAHAHDTAGLPNDYAITSVPTIKQLLNNPHEKMFDDADVIVLVPTNGNRPNNHLHSDPNYGLLLNFIVTGETDPESMNVPIVLDNRSGGFNASLELITDAFAQGRLMGERPFYVATTNEELKDTLVLLKDLKQRSPHIKKINFQEQIKSEKSKIKKVPNDGVFTLFVGGGHANNSKRDLDDAQSFGYQCAKQNWRIVTGGGSLEGSMGAIHTGFIQYHLDQLQNKNDKKTQDYKEKIKEFILPSGKYDAEEVISKKPELLEEMAEKNLIPRDKFWCYSMKPLLEMESPSGNPPPATTYFEAGNIIRRLDGLLSPGAKIFLPGSIGTDHELEETIKQHLEAKRLQIETKSANNNVFTDGTSDKEGRIIIYNRNGHLDKVLNHYNLLGNDPITARRKDSYNVTIVNSLEELSQTSKKVAATWVEKINSGKDNLQNTNNSRQLH